jgi:hypothetical protein
MSFGNYPSSNAFGCLLLRNGTRAQPQSRSLDFYPDLTRTVETERIKNSTQYKARERTP